LDDSRTCKAHTDVEALAIIDRAINVFAIETHAARCALRISEPDARRRKDRQLHRGNETNPPHPAGYDLDRLLRGHVTEHSLMLLIENGAQAFQSGSIEGLRTARNRDLVALPGIAQVERTLDADAVLHKPVAKELFHRLRSEPLEHFVYLGRI